MRALLHRCPRGLDRTARGGHSRDRPGAPVVAVHDRRVQFATAIGGEHAAASGVERRIFFQHARRRLDRIECISAAGQHGLAGVQRCLQPGARGGFMFGGEGVGPHRAAAAVNHQGPGH